MSTHHAWRTLDDVVEGLARLESRFRQQQDRRSIFATLYGMVSTEIRSRVERGFFHDNEWVRRYAVEFANLYAQAIERDEAGKTAEVPKAWRLSFNTARAGTGLVLQDMLLGVNAHVNHDLPHALTSIAIDPDRDARYADHAAVNAVLSSVTEPATERIAALYAPGIKQLDADAGQIDEMLSAFSLDVARDSAWEAAVSLANAKSDAERRLVSVMIASRAAVLARLLRAPSLEPALVHALRRLEQGVTLESLLRE